MANEVSGRRAQLSEAEMQTVENAYRCLGITSPFGEAGVVTARSASNDDDPAPLF